MARPLPPMHTAALSWYQDSPRPSSRAYRDWWTFDHRIQDNIPITKPCDYCGDTVHLAFICDDCAAGWLRYMEEGERDKTARMMYNAVTNTTNETATTKASVRNARDKEKRKQAYQRQKAKMNDIV